MTVFAQHGYGKGQKIEEGLTAGTIGGVILSPKDEGPTALAQTIASVAGNPRNPIVAVDPQFYVTRIPNARDGHLPEYTEYYPGGLARGQFTARNIQTYVRNTIDWQLSLGVDRLITPTISVDGFGTPSETIAGIMAEESVTYHSELGTATPLWISVHLSADAYAMRSSLDDLLDGLTQLEPAGFYMIADRSSEPYRAQMKPAVLDGMLRAVYSLGAVNEFEVVSGYTDVVGVLLQSVGATGSACGWYGNLRQYASKRFEASTGGRRPKPRYTSLPLLNSVFVEDLDTTQALNQMGLVLSGSPYDGVFDGTHTPSDSGWTDQESTLHHWWVLSQLHQAVSNDVITDRLDAVDTLITTAIGTYAALAAAGVLFSPETGPSHLTEWSASINRLRAEFGL
jgi:hypothetical protein